VGGSPGGDLSEIRAILGATDSIPVITGIVNMWRDSAEDMAETFHQIESDHPGRFILGVGIGHPEATTEYRSPFEKIVDYLDRLDAAGVPGDQQMLAALGPRVLRLAADRTMGAHPYFTTPRHTRMARQTMGDRGVLAPEQKVILDTNQERAREEGRRAADRYLKLVNYRNSLKREGWTEEQMSNGGSAELIDSLVLHGTASEVAQGIRAHSEAGADHVCVQVLGSDPMPAYESLARELF
jgi:probable F420-dependent oxidoreductase